MDKLASNAIFAETIILMIVLAWFGFAFSMKICLLQQFMLSMSEGTNIFVIASSSEKIIFAQFCLQFGCVIEDVLDLLRFA
jgi:hypothetical protein